MNETPEQTQPKPCPECGGERVLADCSPNMSVRNPTQHKLNLLATSAGLKALICTNCGYTALYVDPSQLKEAW